MSTLANEPDGYVVEKSEYAAQPYEQESVEAELWSKCDDDIFKIWRDLDRAPELYDDRYMRALVSTTLSRNILFDVKTMPEAVYLRLLDAMCDSISTGIYLSAPFGANLASRKTTAVLKSKSYYVGRQFYYLVERDFVYGFIRFGEAVTMSVAQILELDTHGVTADQIAKWWPGKESLCVYTVLDFIPFPKPMRTTPVEGSNVFVENVQFLEDAEEDEEESGDEGPVEKAGKMKTEGGNEYPASAFAYVPDPDTPSTWKLRLWEDPDKKITAAQLGRAAAAFSAGGFRGNRVQLPQKDQAKVKARIRREYEKLGLDAPKSIQKSGVEGRVNIVGNICKASMNEELRFVFGEVLVPDHEDVQKDIIGVDEIRKAAWGFMQDCQQVGLSHKSEAPGITVVESFLAPVDMKIEEQEIKKGTWLLGVQINNDDVWEDVKQGKYTGFSIEAFATRIPV